MANRKCDAAIRGIGERVMKKEWFFPTAFSHWGDEERAAIDRVISSGQYTMGSEVEAFEHEIAAFHGRKYAIMTNSGSSANLIMVAALMLSHDLSSWDTVAVPALAWSTTYAPLVQNGLKLRLIDCDDTWNACFDDRHRDYDVALCCPILGNPITDPTVGRKRTWIEDNCESLGASINGKLCGTHGVMSSLSFFYSHQISAIEGGAVLTDQLAIADLLRMFRAHGWTKDIATYPHLDGRCFEKEYNFRLFGYNVRPVEMHAAIAREQLRKLPKLIFSRISNLEMFKTMSHGLPIKHQHVVPGATPSPFGLAFTVESNTIRAKLVSALRENGIDCRPPTGGSFRMHEYGKNYRIQKTPEADRIHMMGLFIGNPPYPCEEKIDKAVKVMRSVLT